MVERMGLDGWILEKGLREMAQSQLCAAQCSASGWESDGEV